MKTIDTALDVLRSFVDFAPNFDEKKAIEETIVFLEKISSYGSYGEILKILGKK